MDEAQTSHGEARLRAARRTCARLSIAVAGVLGILGALALGGCKDDLTTKAEWIMHPQKVKPRNAMPDVGLTDGSARDITAFLDTLE